MKNKIVRFFLIILTLSIYTSFSAEKEIIQYMKIHNPKLSDQEAQRIYKNVVYYSNEYEFDPVLVFSVMKTESHFKHSTVSSAGAKGLMQLMPDTAVWVAKEMKLTQFSLGKLEDPEVSIRMGTWYLASLKGEFHDNKILTLAAYNGGRGNVHQWMKDYGWDYSFRDYEKIPFQETREFVRKILEAEDKYRILYGN